MLDTLLCYSMNLVIRQIYNVEVTNKNNVSRYMIICSNVFNYK